MSSDCLKSPTNAEGLSLESPPDVLETGRVWPRWLARLLAVVTVFLVPWTLWLTFSLPTRNVTHHYDVAWVGFDIALAAMFAATAVAAIRSSVWLQPLAAVTGTMLVCDAWFDVVTSASRDEQFVAVLEAVFAELPLAALCAWIVLDTQRFRDELVLRYRRRP